MARQISYSNDSVITGNDRFTGIDALDNSTKNFTVEALATHFAQTGAADPSRLGFQFDHAGDYNGEVLTSGDFRFALSTGGTGFAHVTAIAISDTDVNGVDYTPQSNLLTEAVIKITSVEESGDVNYALYSVSDVSSIGGGRLATVRHIDSVGNLTTGVATITVISAHSGAIIIEGGASIFAGINNTYPNGPEGLITADEDSFFFLEILEDPTDITSQLLRIDVYGPKNMGGNTGWGDPHSITAARVTNVTDNSADIALGTDTTVTMTFSDGSTFEFMVRASAQGAQGIPGPTGAKGDRGDEGPDGPEGQQGMMGSTGARGEQGDEGPIGPDGDSVTAVRYEYDADENTDVYFTVGTTELADFVEINRGQMGAPGNAGSTGPAGPDGPEGDQGVSRIELYSDGDPGAAPTGVTIFTQSFAYDNIPTGFTSDFGVANANGDPYITFISVNPSDFADRNPTTTYNVPDAWATPHPAGSVGPAGPQGPIGHTGSQGQMGDPGVGIESVTNVQGEETATVTYTDGLSPDIIHLPRGPIGNTGPAGTPGAQGPMGNTGNAGATGAQGATGSRGAMGAQGDQGEQGVQGAFDISIYRRYADGQTPATPPQPDATEYNTLTHDLTVPADWFLDVPLGIEPIYESFAYVNPGDDPDNDDHVDAEWSVPILVTGTVGPTGPRGAIGPIGPDGMDGAAATINIDPDPLFPTQTVDFGAGSSVVNNGTEDAALLQFTLERGPRGATGAQGPMGNPGQVGAQGPAGQQGPIGPAGAEGQQGMMGLQGQAGTHGADGLPVSSATGAVAAGTEVIDGITADAGDTIVTFGTSGNSNIGQVIVDAGVDGLDVVYSGTATFDAAQIGSILDDLRNGSNSEIVGVAENNLSFATGDRVVFINNADRNQYFFASVISYTVDPALNELVIEAHRKGPTTLAAGTYTVRLSGFADYYFTEFEVDTADLTGDSFTIDFRDDLSYTVGQSLIFRRQRAGSEFLGRIDAYDAATGEITLGNIVRVTGDSTDDLADDIYEVNLSGERGRTVLNGTTDPADTLGEDGDFYIRTDTQVLFGPKGVTTVGEWDTPGFGLNGTSITSIDDATTGRQHVLTPITVDGLGAVGSLAPFTITDGSTILSGTVAPNTTVTADAGDFYLQIDNTGTRPIAVLFGPKLTNNDTTWPTDGINLVGPSDVQVTTGDAIDVDVEDITGILRLQPGVGYIWTAVQDPTAATPHTDVALDLSDLSNLSVCETTPGFTAIDTITKISFDEAGFTVVNDGNGEVTITNIGGGGGGGTTPTFNGSIARQSVEFSSAAQVVTLTVTHNALFTYDITDVTALPTGWTRTISTDAQSVDITIPASAPVATHTLVVDVDTERISTGTTGSESISVTFDIFEDYFTGVFITDQQGAFVPNSSLTDAGARIVLGATLSFTRPAAQSGFVPGTDPWYIVVNLPNDFTSTISFWQGPSNVTFPDTQVGTDYTSFIFPVSPFHPTFTLTPN